MLQHDVTSQEAWQEFDITHSPTLLQLLDLLAISIPTSTQQGRSVIWTHLTMSEFADATDEPLLLQPDPFQTELHDSFHNIPRYLFRLHGRHTAGTTTQSEVTSPAWRFWRPSEQQRKRDLFQKDCREAGRLLYEHLTWDPAHEATCNLMSWTSSLLFAIQYGLYRNQQTNGYSRTDLRDLFILVVDTSKLPPGTFIRDLDAMKAFLASWVPLDKIYSRRTRPIRRLYFGEYLSQGSLAVQGKSVQTSLERMINSGLFSLVPELQDSKKWKKWADRVVDLREVFESHPSYAVTSKKDVRRATFMAETCFGRHWTLPMTLMLLSLKCRSCDDPIIVEAVLALFTGKSEMAVDGGDCGNSS